MPVPTVQQTLFPKQVATYLCGEAWRHLFLKLHESRQAHINGTVSSGVVDSPAPCLCPLPLFIYWNQPIWLTVLQYDTTPGDFLHPRCYEGEYSSWHPYGPGTPCATSQSQTYDPSREY